MYVRSKSYLPSNSAMTFVNSLIAARRISNRRCRLQKQCCIRGVRKIVRSEEITPPIPPETTNCKILAPSGSTIDFSCDHVVNNKGLRHHDAILVMHRCVVAGVSREWWSAAVAHLYGSRQGKT